MPNPYAALSVNTTKGQAHHAAGVGVFRGDKEKVTWTQSGASVDRETITIDGTVFELVSLATDSTFDVGTAWNNTNAEIQQTLASHTFVVGNYVAVNSEVAKVIYVSGNLVGFKRGEAGSTIVAHATATDPINEDDGTALTAGAVTVPLDALTAENTIDRTLAIVNGHSTANPRGFLWNVQKLSASKAIIVSTIVGSRTATFAETLTNGTVLPATGEGGAAHGSMPVHTVYRAPTAAEVTAGEILVVCPFKPVNTVVTIFDNATGTTKAWDGATLYDQTENVVTIDNSGVTDWAADDFAAITVFGAPVASSVDNTVGE